jgi:hypothetical protein
MKFRYLDFKKNLFETNSLQGKSNFEGNQGIMGSMIPQENQLVVSFFQSIDVCFYWKKIKTRFQGRIKHGHGLLNFYSCRAFLNY